MKRHYARWREHGTPGWLLIYTLEGRGRFGHAGGDLVVGRGELVLLGPRILNDYGLESKLKRWDLLWAYFFPRPDWYALLHWPEVARGLMRLQVEAPEIRRTIVDHLAEAHRFNQGPLLHHEMYAMNELERCLLQCDQINPHSQQSKLDPRVMHALNYLCENLSEPIALPDLARRCGMSLSRLAHLFRAQVGQTPQQFFELKRLTRACRLLELTQDAVATVAAAVGYHDQFHFSNRFRRHLGVSPREYRRRLSSDQKIPYLRVDPRH